MTTIPVLGNGDVWEAWDALRMMRATGCAGVIVGRGCLGRPWLFGELAAEYSIEPGAYYPWQVGLFDPPLEVRDGMVRIPDGPGWGVEVRADWLAAAEGRGL